MHTVILNVCSKNMAGLLAFYFWLWRLSMSMYVHLHASELSLDCSLNIDNSVLVKYGVITL